MFAIWYLCKLHSTFYKKKHIADNRVTYIITSIDGNYIATPGQIKHDLTI